MTVMTTHRVHRPVPATTSRLLAAGWAALADARASLDPRERYAAAHLAALRAAAAVLADRARPDAGRPRRPTSAWSLLVAVAPELGEWASYFAAGADKRAAAEAGMRHAVSAREADDLVRDVTTFLDLVETTLGLLSGCLPVGAAHAGRAVHTG
jgi:hypothetical protein